MGIDRSGGPPAATQKGQPLRPFTIPNIVSYARIALLPVFLVVALGSDDGREAWAAAIYFLIAWGDQLDGLLARVTGQYSRLGALLDPLTDRALVLVGVVVCFHFELLPRWALVALAARELFMLGLTQFGLRKGMDLGINMVGRWAVWPVMFAVFLTLIVDSWVADASLYLGLALTLWATALYVRDGVRFLRSGSDQASLRPPSSSA
ncbi:MAG: CDP-alcohol phosphatidyltransferase family protein [Thermoleophilaceae bacterium]|nr:CDP-alcohol phosphatidyltransferase family protein [Thermoleophilaceae bacterium]